jgi:hypothetical protein
VTRRPATGLVATDGKYAGLVAGAFVVGSSHSLTIFTVLPLIDAGSIGRLKPVVMVADVDQPSSALSASRMNGARNEITGRFSVRSVVPEKKNGSAG